MDIIAVKVLVAILFAAIRFLFGVIPIKLYRWMKLGPENVISEERRTKLEFGVAIVQAFGGGVLFATCFLHMMPEVYCSVEDLKKYGVLGADYPYSQLVISLGFFTIYFAEEISQWLISKAPKEPYRKRAISRIESAKTVVCKDSKIFPKSPNIPRGMAFEIPKTQSYFIENIEPYVIEYNEKNEKNFEDNVSAEVVVDNVDREVQTETEKNVEMLKNLENNMDLDADVTAEIEEIIEEEVKTQQQILRCFLMVVALSFHSIFEGLAIGLQQSTKNIWYLFTAVSIHSATILFCMGLEVVLAGTKIKTTVIHISMLSGTSPFGVLLGLLITLTTDLHTGAKSFAIVLLLGLSAGTILYITFFETLSREKERRTSRLIRAISIGVGFTLMALLECLKIGGA